MTFIKRVRDGVRRGEITYSVRMDASTCEDRRSVSDGGRRDLSDSSYKARRWMTNHTMTAIPAMPAPLLLDLAYLFRLSLNANSTPLH